MEVYKPREDTELIKKHLKTLKVKDKEILEIGTGSGEIAIEIAQRNGQVTATDINKKALGILKEKTEKQNLETKLKTVESNLYDNIEKKYDIIIFNPPYLPDSEFNDPIWSGGPKGIETTEDFLKKTKKYLKEGGTAYIIASSRADYKKLVNKYDLEIVSSQKIWFEKLFLLKYTT